MKETPNLNIIIDELVYNTEYSFQVAAYDLAGNLSALSSSLKVTTKDIPRIPPVISNKKSNENLAKTGIGRTALFTDDQFNNAPKVMTDGIKVGSMFR